MDLKELLRRITNHPIWWLAQIGAVLTSYIVFYNTIKTWIDQLPSVHQNILIISSALIIIISLYNKYFNPKVPIYSRRNDFIGNDLHVFIKKSKSIKIVNISFSIFKSIDSLQDIISKKISDGGSFEILFARRQRSNKDEDKEEISYLKIRQEDESNSGLIQKTNQTLFELFLFMLTNLYPRIISMVPETNDKGKTEIQRKESFRKFQVKEYPFYPVMCMYIFDDTDIIFGPYIAADCDRIPLFHLRNKAFCFGKLFKSDINGAYGQLIHHYNILSTPDKRFDKRTQYINQFCYYNGNEDISIHEFIEKYYDELRDYLGKDVISDYENYILDYSNTDFDDQSLKNLKNPIEGRFDAVMRDIKRNIDKNG